MSAPLAAPAAPAVILGAVAGVGGGMLRDVLVGQIPSVLRRGLAAISARTAAAITVTAVSAGSYGLPAAAGAVLACFLIAVLGVRYDLNAPMAPEPAQRTRPSRRTKAEVPVAVLAGFLVSAGILALIPVIALFVMRVSREDLSGAGPAPEPDGDASSPGRREARRPRRPDLPAPAVSQDAWPGSAAGRGPAGRGPGRGRRPRPGYACRAWRTGGRCGS